MEIIDKEELLDKHGAYWVSKFDKKKSIDCKDAISAIEEVESYYLKQIEEKDKRIQLYEGLLSLKEKEANKYLEELEEAKELLNEILQSGYDHNIQSGKLEEFLNKQD